MPTSSFARRELIAGVAALGTVLLSRGVRAQPKSPSSAAAPSAHAERTHDAAPAPPISAALKAIVDSTASCERDGRYCLARCTEHLAAGAPHMEQCQRAVMNMLSVTGAMADVAGYRNADPKHIKALASACAAFCRACAKACEPHAKHHEECKACMDSCLTCAKACEAYTA